MYYISIYHVIYSRYIQCAIYIVDILYEIRAVSDILIKRRQQQCRSPRESGALHAMGRLRKECPSRVPSDFWTSHRRCRPWARHIQQTRPSTSHKSYIGRTSLFEHAPQTPNGRRRYAYCYLPRRPGFYLPGM